MTWLIDTNIISEVRKGQRCHPAVAAWWAGVEDRDLFLSALTLGEIRKGIEGVRARDPAKAAALEDWLAEIVKASGRACWAWTQQWPRPGGSYRRCNPSPSSMLFSRRPRACTTSSSSPATPPMSKVLELGC